MPLREGETILNGKYRIVKLLGEGGMARVWLAEELTFGGRKVAIKEIKREALSAQEVREVEDRFAREMRIGGKLFEAEVPNVVRPITTEKLDGETLLVMEYMPGGSLSDRLKDGPLPVDEAVEITLQLLEALGPVHEQLGLVHRDIKPSNVLFGADGRIRLADFGLAQMTESDRSVDAGKPHPGTQGYMSPEQAATGDYLTPRSDLYTVGCLLFEMLTGRRYQYCAPGTEASQLRTEIPDWLDGILEKALAENPWERYESAEHMRSVLAKRGVVEEPPTRPPTSRPTERPRSWARYRRDQVIIQGEGIPVTPPMARFTVFQESTSPQPIFPKVKEELEYPIQVGDGARVEGCMYSAHALLVGDGAVLSKPIYGRKEVRIGQDCELASHVVSSGPVSIGKGTKISGCLLVSGGPIEIADDCQIAEIWAEGNLTVGARAKIESIETSGDVVLQSRCDVRWIRARHVRVDSGGHVHHIVARGDLSLGTGVVVDTIHVRGKLEINPPLEIRLMDTLVVRNVLPAHVFPFSMKGQMVTQDNAFIWDGKKLLPFKGGQTIAPDGLMVVTLCLNHSLHRAIQAAIRNEPSLLIMRQGMQ